jgi:hypothetical protein
LQVNDTQDGESRIWSDEEENEIDLFAESYITDGEITVQSDGSESVTNLVAPGTSGKYKFTVQNTGSLPLTYYITVKKGTFSLDGTELPIRLKLASDENRIIDDASASTAGSTDSGVPEAASIDDDPSDAKNAGENDARKETGTESTVGADGTTWGEATYQDSLDNYEIKSQTVELKGNTSDEYTLDWTWLFDNGDDATDTKFGNYSAARSKTGAEPEAAAAGSANDEPEVAAAGSADGEPETAAAGGADDEPEVTSAAVQGGAVPAAIDAGEEGEATTETQTVAAAKVYDPQYRLTITVHAEYDLPGSSGGGNKPDDTQIEDNPTLKDPLPDDDTEIGSEERDKVNSDNNDNDDNNDDDTSVVNKLQGLLPKTGDTATIVLWILIMISCVAGAAALVLIGRRNHKKHE